MEILGVGPSEFVFVVLIAIIVLGPQKMREAGQVIGRWLNRFIQSDTAKLLNDVSNLPRKLMQDANEELWKADMKQNSIAPPSHIKQPTTTYKAPQQSKPRMHHPTRRNNPSKPSLKENETEEPLNKTDND